METQEIINQMTDLFRDELDNDGIQLHADTTAKDVEGWDSLTHIQLIVSIEKKYKIRFTSSEIAGFKNVGDMAECIKNKSS